MKASDIEVVREQLDNLRTASNALASFRAIPETATQIHVLIRWPNPDPDARFRDELVFGVFLPIGDRTANATMEAIRTQLEAAVRAPADQLRALGVNPDA